MEGLRAAAYGLRAVKPGLTVGCTLEISGLVLLPVFSRLKRALGDEVAIRVVVYDYDVLPLLVQAGLDIVFEGATTGLPDDGAVKVMDEEIVPVASPALLERFGDDLAGHPRHWSGVPRLDIGRRSPGWATWDTWFAAHDCASPDAPVETFENYIHLLRAAADGDGIAIGWNGFMSDYVELGRIVALRDAVAGDEARHVRRPDAGRTEEPGHHGVPQATGNADRRAVREPPGGVDGDWHLRELRGGMRAGTANRCEHCGRLHRGSA